VIKKRIEWNYKTILCILFAILILASIVARVRMLSLDISLWNDEALLAENVVGRDFAGMLTPPLANLQTAPALYLIVVKALTFVFGTSEWVLRVYSLVCLALMLIAQGILMRKSYGVRPLYTVFALAVSATFLYYMRYSGEFKPYMGDALFALVVLLAYHLYRNHRIPALLLAGAFSVSMLFSTPAAFFAAGCLIVELALKIRRRDRRAILLAILAGAIVLAVFLLNYKLWLEPIATDGDMQWYWRENRFSFRFFDAAAMEKNYWLFYNLLEPLGSLRIFVLVLAGAGFLVSLARRHVPTLAVGVAGVLLLAASSAALYPLQNRLWMFAFVLLFVYAFVFLSSLRFALPQGKAARAVQSAVPLLLAFVLLVPNARFLDYGRGAQWTLTPGCQANPLIAYLQEAMRDDETLYCYHSAAPILKYKIGYDTDRIGDVSHDNILFGSNWDFAGDVERIVEASEKGGVYILFYHAYKPLSGDDEIEKLVAALDEKGYMEKILDEYETPLYWFSTQEW
jgi:hypothetical protein